MFIVRSVKESDLDSLFELSGLATFINLPHNKDDLNKIIQTSVKSFNNPSDKLWRNYYVFVLEDISTNKVIGVSMIHAQHGSPDEPHFYLKIGQEHLFSKTINTGFVHGTLKLGHDIDGPSEIGGLVLHPDYRKNPLKLGKFLSFSRFLFMAKNPELFKNEIHCELMPPLDSKGNSPLWEALGRKFMNMNYHAADKLSRKNKEFILSLFPSQNIYISLLQIEARNSIGKVGDDTQPVKYMLESIGFKFNNEVDPFDGGPHYRASLNDITLVSDSKKTHAVSNKNVNGQLGLFEIPLADVNFACALLPYEAQSDKEVNIGLNELEKLKIENEFDTIYFPY